MKVYTITDKSVSTDNIKDFMMDVENITFYIIKELAEEELEQLHDDTKHIVEVEIDFRDYKAVGLSNVDYGRKFDITFYQTAIN